MPRTSALLAPSACHAERPTGAVALEGVLGADWSALSSRVLTNLPEDRAGGQLVVWLHGYGGSGDGQARVARRFATGGRRIVLPTAVLPHASGRGFMWWEFLDEDWPKPFTPDPDARSWLKPSRQLPRARQAVIDLIGRQRAEHRPDELVLVGFSQGAMLALDVAVHLEPPPDRVAVLAGYALLATAEQIPKATGERPVVLISNGRSDTIVPFERAERMRQLLEENGFAVTFAPHDGGHRLDHAVLESLERFLDASTDAVRSSAQGGR